VVADYRRFAARAAALAATLQRDYAIGLGERVAIFMPNSTDYLILLYAVWYAGAVVVPINAKLHVKEAAWIVGDARARMVFTTAKSATEMRSLLACGERQADVIIVDEGDAFDRLFERAALTAPVARERDDLAWLFYTSGTTGKPKGVMMSHGNIHAMAFSYFVDVDEVHRSDAALYAAPISHGAGIYNFMHVMRGARHVVPESGGFEADEILNLAARLRNVSMFAAPTMVSRLTAAARQSGKDGDGLRTIVYGGGPMYLADISEALDVFGPRFVQIYGQGESPMTITALPRDILGDRDAPTWAARAASVGLPQSCVEVRVADARGNSLPPGESGEILVRGAPVMLGYWNNPEATAKTIQDGWLFTGDVGQLDEDGYLTLKDRSKDVIISGGTNIYPREVEEALLTHEAVREVSVVGAPNAEWGEDVVAFVVLDPERPISTAELDAYCLEQIARFKRPKRYVVVKDLPKNNYGKVLKNELRSQLKEDKNSKEKVL
jgi:long-chain acyl-CoA synthetase